MSVTVRPVEEEDAQALADLLNPIIARGGTTALDEPFTPAALAEAYLTGPDVVCCFVAIDTATGQPVGFQTLYHHPPQPDDCRDIGTFARIGVAQKGVGSALFASTSEFARNAGLSAINACIRADNVGGLAFYAKLRFEDHSVDAGVPLKNGTPIDRINKRYAL